MEIAIPILIGLAAGVGSGLFGIGGGIIIVPLVVFYYKFSQQTATATSLIALLLPVGAMALWHYHKSGYVTMVNVKIGLLISFGLFIGALLGARIATSLSSETLTKLFAGFLILVAIRMLMK
jgi:uncharacterized membrane protein YfcA